MKDKKLRDINYHIHPDHYFNRGTATPYVFDIETYPLFNEYDDSDENKRYWIQECDKKKYTLDNPDIEFGTHEYYKECWYTKSSFSPTFARILCISVGWIESNQFFKKSFYDNDEFVLIQKFINHVHNISPNLIIGHNITNFDIPFFSRRAIANRFSLKELPKQLNTYKKKSWNCNHIIDTYDLCKWNGQNSVSLGALCYELGIPSPKDGDIDGSKIREYISNGGDIKTVVKYCERDITANFKVFERIFLSDFEYLQKKRQEYHNKKKLNDSNMIL